MLGAVGGATLLGLLLEARAVVGEEGSAFPLVLWRLRRMRPGDAAVRAQLARMWPVEPVPPDDLPAPDPSAAR
jgi:hypothetical protein